MKRSILTTIAIGCLLTASFGCGPQSSTEQLCAAAAAKASRCVGQSVAPAQTCTAESAQDILDMSCEQMQPADGKALDAWVWGVLGLALGVGAMALFNRGGNNSQTTQAASNVNPECNGDYNPVANSGVNGTADNPCYNNGYANTSSGGAAMPVPNATSHVNNGHVNNGHLNSGYLGCGQAVASQTQAASAGENRTWRCVQYGGQFYVQQRHHQHGSYGQWRIYTSRAITREQCNLCCGNQSQCTQAHQLTSSHNSNYVVHCGHATQQSSGRVGQRRCAIHNNTWVKQVYDGVWRTTAQAPACQTCCARHDYQCSI